MSDYISGDVQCPFFRNVDRKQRKISCEGLEPQSNVQLVYRRQDAMARQAEIFCCENYENCEIYRAILEARYPDYNE